MDGLLIDSEPLWHQAEVEIFGDLGVPLERAQTRSTKGMYVDEVVRYWFDRYPWSGPTTSDVRDLILGRVGDLVVEQGLPMPGARETVRAMADRGPVALASSTPNALIRVVLSHLDLEDAFPIICSAEDEEYGKPNPAVFLTAAKTLGVAPERCCVPRRHEWCASPFQNCRNGRIHLFKLLTSSWRRSKSSTPTTSIS